MGGFEGGGQGRKGMRMHMLLLEVGGGVIRIDWTDRKGKKISNESNGKERTTTTFMLDNSTLLLPREPYEAARRGRIGLGYLQS
jgi:hypothetical protein